MIVGKPARQAGSAAARGLGDIRRLDRLFIPSVRLFNRRLFGFRQASCVRQETFVFVVRPDPEPHQPVWHIRRQGTIS